MASTYSWSTKVWIPAAAIIVLGLATAIKEGVIKDFGILLDNKIFPKTYLLTVYVKVGNNDILKNTAIEIDSLKSYVTDDDGKIIVKLLSGIHHYDLKYKDTSHSYTVDLDTNSQVTIHLHALGNDQIVKQTPAVVNAATPKQVYFPQQWFKPGWTVQFDNINVALLTLNKDSKEITVKICHTSTPYHCDNSIVDHVTLKPDSSYTFNYNRDTYQFFLQSIDHAGKDYSTLAAFVDMKKTTP